MRVGNQFLSLYNPLFKLHVRLVITEEKSHVQRQNTKRELYSTVLEYMREYNCGINPSQLRAAE